ncbi:type II toxin-antitoxin system PemK/MazF family toxin, partial [Klebsiella pneumoniae]|uniref:type II toxin-antitoxin system PemK/MazF family toxin n=1 Tax=Klebsiella pneumoniae TaxID=573 RepID=UPI00224A946D
TKVVWIDFGFNIADEFGGKHPAIIYRPSGNQVFVFPLTTQPPNSRNKDLFVKVDYIKNFKKMDRWVNILNLKCVSVQRIDFTSDVGEVNGKVMNDLSA